MNVVLIKSQTPNEEIGLRDPSGLAMAVKQPQQIVFSKELYPQWRKKLQSSNQLNQNIPFIMPINERLSWQRMFFQA